MAKSYKTAEDLAEAFDRGEDLSKYLYRKSPLALLKITNKRSGHFQYEFFTDDNVAKDTLLVYSCDNKDYKALLWLSTGEKIRQEG